MGCKILVHFSIRNVSNVIRIFTFRRKKDFAQLWISANDGFTHKNDSNLVSISSTFYEQTFHIKVLHEAFLYNQTLSWRPYPYETICLQRHPVWGPFSQKLPLNNDHLPTMVTILGSHGWSLYIGLTLLSVCVCIFFFVNVALQKKLLIKCWWNWYQLFNNLPMRISKRKLPHSIEWLYGYKKVLVWI